MPYISRMRRADIDAGDSDIESAGELNYRITCRLLDYIQYHKLSYQTINDVLGALEGCKQEFYRRVAVPYEESKKRENGDVYPL